MELSSRVLAQHAQGPEFNPLCLMLFIHSSCLPKCEAKLSHLLPLSKVTTKPSLITGGKLYWWFRRSQEAVFNYFLQRSLLNRLIPWGILITYFSNFSSTTTFSAPPLCSFPSKLKEAQQFLLFSHFCWLPKPSGSSGPVKYSINKTALP